MLNAAKKLEEDVKLIHSKSIMLDKEKVNIIKKFQEFENEKAVFNNERINLEHLKNELKLRMQSIEVNLI